MQCQTQVNSQMRAVLINWLLEIQEKLNLSERTLFLSVNIVDRVMQHRPIQRNRLQLLGVTSFFLASKFEDQIPPHLSQIVQFCDGIYSKEEILQQEQEILSELNFQLIHVSSYDLLTVTLKANQVENQLISRLSMQTLRSLLFFKQYGQIDPFQMVHFALLLSKSLISGSLSKNPRCMDERFHTFYQTLKQTSQ